MNKNLFMKHLPIKDFIKETQELIQIVNLKHNYNELMQKYGFDYEIWEESAGFMIGGCLEINEYRYILKASLNHSVKQSLVGVYVLTDAKNRKQATVEFIKELGLSSDDFNKI